MISFRQSGNFKNTDRFFNRSKNMSYKKILDFYGRAGVRALEKATPADTGLTGSSWDYTYEIERNRISLYWSNKNKEDGVPVAILIQYGHGTRNGGYVQGTDYINPAMKPIFDNLAEEAWKEITSL